MNSIHYFPVTRSTPIVYNNMVLTLRTTEYFPRTDEPPEHCEGGVADEDDGDVVHVVCLDGHHGWETEEDCREDSPQHTKTSACATNEERAGS